MKLLEEDDDRRRLQTKAADTYSHRYGDTIMAYFLSLRRSSRGPRSLGGDIFSES